METITKQERSEYIGIWVTPQFKKEFDVCKDDPSIREELVKRYLKGEVDFLQQELTEIDNITIKYKARLIGIKENFEKAQSIYVEEIESLYNNVSNADQKISKSLQQSNESLFAVRSNLATMKKELDNIDVIKINNATSSLERILDTIDRFNKMPDNEKELLKTLLSK